MYKSSGLKKVGSVVLCDTERQDKYGKITASTIEVNFGDKLCIFGVDMSEELAKIRFGKWG